LALLAPFLKGSNAKPAACGVAAALGFEGPGLDGKPGPKPLGAKPLGAKPLGAALVWEASFELSCSFRVGRLAVLVADPKCVRSLSQGAKS
jgi:hypothetical protein